MIVKLSVLGSMSVCECPAAVIMTSSQSAPLPSTSAETAESMVSKMIEQIVNQGLDVRGEIEDNVLNKFNSRKGG